MQLFSLKMQRTAALQPPPTAHTNGSKANAYGQQDRCKSGNRWEAEFIHNAAI
jgi:hypothetical protein